MKSKTAGMNNEVRDLSLSWRGTDFSQFKIEWVKVDNENSVYAQMLRALESYSSYLKYASESYKDAQNRAQNKAMKLPK